MEIETFDMFDVFRVTWDDVAVWMTYRQSSKVELQERWLFDQTLRRRENCRDEILRAKVTGEFWTLGTADSRALEFVDEHKESTTAPRLMVDRFSYEDEARTKLNDFYAQSLKKHKELTEKNKKTAPRRGRPRGSGMKPKPST